MQARLCYVFILLPRNFPRWKNKKMKKKEGAIKGEEDAQEKKKKRTRRRKRRIVTEIERWMLKTTKEREKEAGERELEKIRLFPQEHETTLSKELPSPRRLCA